MSRKMPPVATGTDGTDPSPGLIGGAFLLACVLLAFFLFATGGDQVRIGEDTLVTAQPVASGGDAIATTRGSLGGGTAGRRLAEALVLQPRISGGRVTGYTIVESSGASALMRAKLRPGDILLDLDGQPLDADRIAGLANELATADSIEVSFERQGQLRKRVIDLRG